MLILLPPSEAKWNRPRGRPVDVTRWSFPALTDHRRRVATALREVSAGPSAAAELGVSERLAGDIGRNLTLDQAPATPAAQVYTGVLYDALDLPGLGTAARRRANRWIVIVSALYGAVRPTDRITAYRLAMGVDLRDIGPLAASWRPRLAQVLPDLVGRGVVVDGRSAPYAAAWPASGDLARRWAMISVPGASHMAKHTRGLVARRLCEIGANPTSVPALASVLGAHFEVVAHEPSRPGRPWRLDVTAKH